MAEPTLHPAPRRGGGGEQLRGRRKLSDTIRIRGLTVHCVVGVYPHERHTAQPLRIDLDLSVDTEKAGARERIRDTVDYAAVTAQVTFLLEAGNFHMLETAAHVLAKYLLSPPPPSARTARIDAVRIRLEKPHALGGNGVASLEIERDRAWFQDQTAEKPFGQIDIVHETRRVGVYRLHIRPRATIPLQVHRRLSKSEMILTDGLLCQGEPAPRLSTRTWPIDAPHMYENPTDEVQTILRLDTPPSPWDDDVMVDGTPERVAPDLRFVLRERP